MRIALLIFAVMVAYVLLWECEAKAGSRLVAFGRSWRRARRRSRKAAVGGAAAPVQSAGYRRSSTFASTSVLALTLILALGTIGVVQGLWSKNLTISGVVETGDLNADWDKIRTEDRCGQTDEADITTQTSGVSSQTTSGGYGDGYGDQDGGTDDPCPPDPCGGSANFGSSSGGGDPCPPDPCGSSATFGSSSGGSDPCPPDFCSSSANFGSSSGSDPCPPDPCGSSTTNSSSGGSDPCPPDPCGSSATSSSSGGSDPCPPDPCDGSTTYSTTGGSSDSSSGSDGGNNCPPSCEVTIGGLDGDAEFGNQVAYVDIENATPGYWCKIKGWVSNLGSIPFNIIGINGVLDDANDKGLSFYDLNGSQPGVCKLIDEQGNDSDERQVDPGDEGIVYCKILIDESTKTCTRWYSGTCKEWTYTEGAKYGWNYHFAVEVCVAQWNEDPSPGGAAADFNACKHPSSGTHEGPDTPVLPTPGPTP